MHIDHSREKLIQSVIFFSKNVRKLGKIKLFKILYFLDFMHFKDTGRSVTELNYSAWKMGPVPVQLLVNLGLIHREQEVVPYWDGWLAWMRQQGWRRFGWYVWDQGPGLPGDWNDPGSVKPYAPYERQGRTGEKCPPPPARQGARPVLRNELPCWLPIVACQSLAANQTD